MMWQLDNCSFYYPNVVSFYSFERGPVGNEDSTLMFSSRWLGKPTKRIFLWAQALTTSLSLMPFTQHDPPIYKHIFHNFVLGHAKEYFKTVYTLTTFSPTPTSFDTISILIVLHLESNNFFLFIFRKLRTRPKPWTFIWFL